MTAKAIRSPYLSCIRTKEAVGREKKKSPIFSWLIKEKEDKMKGRAPGIPVQTEGPLQAVLFYVSENWAALFYKKSPKRKGKD